jgi:glycosyltransferase involved in cell wall biosynthesis
MKDLCIDARMLFASGIGTYLQNLLPRLQQRGNFRLHLLVDSASVDALPCFTQCNVISLQAATYSLAEQFDLPRHIPRCDLFWSPHYNVPIFSIAAKKRIVTIHDTTHLSLPALFSWRQRLYAKQMMQRAAQSSAQLITVSNFSQQEIISHLKVDHRKIRVIYPGVDSDFFNTIAEKSPTTRSPLSRNERFFLCVGNVKPHKNILRLLQGFSHAVAELDNTHLIIAGKTFQPFYDQLQSWVHQKSPQLQKKIHFLGFVNHRQLLSLYREAVATILPSLCEGFGLPAIEAMRCGCAVAVSNSASLPEVCEDAALYFDPTDPEEIGSTLQQLVKNEELRLKLSKQGLLRSHSFSWEKSAETHLQLFEELCHK